jgi:2-iminobutanoate/2-iminopropanoate deaminase
MIATLVLLATAQYINPPTLLKNPRYTQVMKLPTGQIIVSGQAGQKVDGALAGPDFASQAVQALENVRLALAAAGAKPADIVRINTYIVDIDKNIAAYRDARDKFFKGVPQRPASTTIGVSSLVMTGGLIEIEVTAFKQDQLVRR